MDEGAPQRILTDRIAGVQNGVEVRLQEAGELGGFDAFGAANRGS